MTSEGKKPSKLCRRTFFSQSGTAPTISEIRSVLGDQLADIIVDTLEPSQRTAVQPDRIVVPKDSSALVGEKAHDTEKVREQIHEHIIQIGGNISHRVDGYWRRRLKQAASTGISPDEVDFIRFQCRQKLAIVREEERKRYEELLENMAGKLEQRFWDEKGDLHRSYAKAREIWGEFVCRKVRNQAKNMLCKIAKHYREQLEREVRRRMQAEKSRIIQEMELIVKTAVNQQKRMDERAMEWLVYQYEELLKFIGDYNDCLQTVEMTREVCRLQSGQRECRSTQVSGHLSTLDEPHCPVGSEHVINFLKDLEEDVCMPSTSSSNHAFECLPELGSVDLGEAEPFSLTQLKESLNDFLNMDDQDRSSEQDSGRSSIEKVVIGGLTYAQPKYYKKIYNELFRDVVMSWEKLDSVEEEEKSKDPICCLDSSSTSVEDHSKSSFAKSDTSESFESEPSYRESYDAMSAIHDVLESQEPLPMVEPTAHEEFGELFDISKSEEEITSFADTLASQYIRATSADFESMFPKISEES